MKTLLFIAVLVYSATASARTLEISVPNVRNDKGSVLVMASVAGQEQPVYAKAPARKGEVRIRLDLADAAAADVSIFHDEDGDYRMKQGDRGPVEGYAVRKCKLAAEENPVTMKLYYPAE